MTQRAWQLREVNEHTVAALQQACNVPEIVARVMAGRGVGIADAPAFLHPTLKNSLPNPFDLLDMQKAASRVASAIEQRETMAIFGDYDVDGATSTALLSRFFRLVGASSIAYIPDRIKEGYGPNAAALLTLREQGATTVITVDCGTLAFEALKAGTQAGLDIIVLDHHQGEARLPECFAVVNPNRLDETSPHRQLAAVGVTFLFIVAVNKILRDSGYYNLPSVSAEEHSDDPYRGGSGSGGRSSLAPLLKITEPNLTHLLDIVALGTVADVVPLTGVNRALVKQGLKVMAQRRNSGLCALMDAAHIEEAPTTYHLGFVCGPRINAGGRVGKPDYGARILSTEDEHEAAFLAAELEQFNKERKAIESVVMEQAMAQAEAQKDHPCILVKAEGWHPGVIGIVAGRIKEKFHRPAAVVAFADGIGKASARSIVGIDFGAAVIAALQEGLLIAGGGHAMAAGFTVAQEKLDDLHRFLSVRMERGVENAARTVLLDGYVHVHGLTAELASMLEQAGPFGSGNPAPKLAVENVRIIKADKVGENHVRILAIDANADKAQGAKLSAIAFRAVDTPLGELLMHARSPVSLAGELKLGFWQGAQTVSLHIEDAIASER